MFRVGGVINLKSMLCIPEDGGDVYVAGQTAPGDGITLIGYDFGAKGKAKSDSKCTAFTKLTADGNISACYVDHSVLQAQVPDRTF